MKLTGKIFLGVILAVVVGVGGFNLLFERYEVGYITHAGITETTYAYRLKSGIALSIGSFSWLFFVALIVFWEAISKYANLHSFWINYGGLIAISAICLIMGWINAFVAIAFLVLLGFILAFEHKELTDKWFYYIESIISKRGEK